MYHDKGLSTQYYCVEIILGSENKTYLNAHKAQKHFSRIVFIDKCRYNGIYTNYSMWFLPLKYILIILMKCDSSFYCFLFSFFFFFN